MFALGAEIREALQHAIKVNKEGSCQWPRARVIPVRDVYPSPSTTYIPHCAILHRCSDDTGCCRSEALTCVPKHSHRVELSFYVSPSRNFFCENVIHFLQLFSLSRCNFYNFLFPKFDKIKCTVNQFNSSNKSVFNDIKKENSIKINSYGNIKELMWICSSMRDKFPAYFSRSRNSTRGISHRRHARPQ